MKSREFDVISRIPCGFALNFCSTYYTYIVYLAMSTWAAVSFVFHWEVVASGREAGGSDG